MSGGKYILTRHYNECFTHGNGILTLAFNLDLYDVANYSKRFISTTPFIKNYKIDLSNESVVTLEVESIEASFNVDSAGNGYIDLVIQISDISDNKIIWRRTNEYTMYQDYKGLYLHLIKFGAFVISKSEILEVTEVMTLSDLPKVLSYKELCAPEIKKNTFVAVRYTWNEFDKLLSQLYAHYDNVLLDDDEDEKWSLTMCNDETPDETEYFYSKDFKEDVACELRTAISNHIGKTVISSHCETNKVWLICKERELN